MLSADEAGHLDRLTLAASAPAASAASGLRHARVRGGGLEFQDYRHYQPGDDLEIHRLDRRCAAPAARRSRVQRRRTPAAAPAGRYQPLDDGRRSRQASLRKKTCRGALLHRRRAPRRRRRRDLRRHRAQLRRSGRWPRADLQSVRHVALGGRRRPLVAQQVALRLRRSRARTRARGRDSRISSRPQARSTGFST